MELPTLVCWTPVLVDQSGHVLKVIAVSKAGADAVMVLARTMNWSNGQGWAPPLQASVDRYEPGTGQWPSTDGEAPSTSGGDTP